MNTVLVKICLIAVLLMHGQSIASTTAPPAPAAPTLNAAQAQFDAAKYRESLQTISQAMTTTKRDSTDRYDLLMLRAECMIRLKQKSSAVAAAETAMGIGKRQRDLDRAAKATALSALLDVAGPDLTYPPKIGPQATGGETFDVIDLVSRQKAMGALFEKKQAAIQPRIAKALEDSSLKSTDVLMRDLWELYAIEQAATSDTAETSKQIESLGDHAHELIGAEIKRIGARLDQLDDLAGQVIWTDDILASRGLRSDERNELKQLSDSLAEIQPVVENARRIARLFGRTGEKWDSLLSDLADARESAQRAYDRRY